MSQDTIVREPIFYQLPAECVEEGMSTADGQTVLDIGWFRFGRSR